MGNATHAGGVTIYDRDNTCTHVLRKHSSRPTTNFGAQAHAMPCHTMLSETAILPALTSTVRQFHAHVGAVPLRRPVHKTPRL